MLVGASGFRGNKKGLKGKQMEEIAEDIDGCIHHLKQILTRSTGVYPLYIHFVEYVGTYQVWTCQPSYLSLGKKREYITKLLFLLKKLLHKPLRHKLSIILFSRYRPILTTNGSETDYLFDSVISELSPNYSIGLVSNEFRNDCKAKYDDPRVINYNLFEFLDVKIVLQSIISAFPTFYKYRRARSDMSDSQRAIFDRFFSVGYLVYLHVRDLCLKNLLELTQPELLISNDDSLDFKPVIGSASFLHMILQSALIYEREEWRRGRIFSHFELAEEFKADYFLVSGGKIKDIKGQFFNDAKEIVIVGQPRYDFLRAAHDIYDRTKILENLGMDPGKLTLLWITQSHAMSEKERRETIVAVSAAVCGLGDVQLIVKPHPDEDQDFYSAELAPLLGKSCQIADKYSDTYSLLYASNLVITKDSTVGFEAVALDKPLIVLNLSGEPESVEYVKEGIAVGVYKEDDLLPALNRLLADDTELQKHREKFISDYLYRIDGRATERIANIVSKSLTIHN
jgi:hypothetical protein